MSVGEKRLLFLHEKKNDIEINITKFYYLDSNALFIRFFLGRNKSKMLHP